MRRYFAAVADSASGSAASASSGHSAKTRTSGKRSGVTDHIEETIALGGRQGTDLNIVVGFQQSPEVVDFYKKFRGR